MAKRRGRPCPKATRKPVANGAERHHIGVMYRNISNIRIALALVTVAWATTRSSDASGEPFVHQPITLPSSQWELGLGLGIGHEDLPAPLEDITGLGLNLELRGGLTSSLQLGLRTGIRLGSEGRLTQADRFGRAFETETYGTGIDSFANPEISLRQALLRTEAVGLALEGRLYLPLEDGTELGIMVALPLHLHLSDNTRFDSGIYVPIFFTDPATRVISFPFQLWFQANDGCRPRGADGRTPLPAGGRQHRSAWIRRQLRHLRSDRPSDLVSLPQREGHGRHERLRPRPRVPGALVIRNRAVTIGEIRGAGA